ncbi:hypothetical protein [Arsenophonus sp. PmNCSU2021_1]|uniref:hypothetical protein n=1 Tax=Arsenophonus sp. PmNCSU2021_1 TaxID=3118989 RepID=UPI002FF3835C
MDNPTKYEHPDFFLFLNLYFFFGDCETRDVDVLFNLILHFSYNKGINSAITDEPFFSSGVMR